MFVSSSVLFFNVIQMDQSSPVHLGALLFGFDVLRLHLSNTFLAILLLVALSLLLTLLRCAARCNNEHDRAEPYAQNTCDDMTNKDQK